MGSGQHLYLLCVFFLLLLHYIIIQVFLCFFYMIYLFFLQCDLARGKYLHSLDFESVTNMKLQPVLVVIPLYDHREAALAHFYFFKRRWGLFLVCHERRASSCLLCACTTRATGGQTFLRGFERRENLPK